jgi:antitoxin HicB
MKPGKKRKTADHSGSTFDSFLEEEGIRAEVEAVAIKRVLARQRQQERRPATVKAKRARTCR